MHSRLASYCPRRLVLLAIVPLAALLVSCSLKAPKQTGNQALPFKVDKQAVQDADEIPMQYVIETEPKSLTVLPHLIMVYGGSDVDVTVSRKGDTVTIVEKENLGSKLSSKGQMFKVAETLDISLLPAGRYTVAVETHLWNGSAGKYDVSTQLSQVVLLGQ